MRFNVPYDYVVQGYSIWKHIFIKNLASEENIVKEFKENKKWKIPLKEKKYISEFFLPKYCLSTKKTDNKRLGVSPNTV